MQTLVYIFLCMFAVYGIYSFIVGICVLFSGKARIIYSVRASSPNLECDISIATSVALAAHARECDPVILCENAEEAELVRERGFDVYIKSN